MEQYTLNEQNNRYYLNCAGESFLISDLSFNLQEKPTEYYKKALQSLLIEIGQPEYCTSVNQIDRSVF